MKKVLVVVAACSMLGVVRADVDVNFANDATPVSGVGSGGTVDVGEVLAQLIWSASAPTAQAGDNAVLGSGEFLLKDFLAPAGNFGTFSAGLDIYLDSDVGNADVNTGYLFVRMFDDSAKAQGDWYLQFSVAGPTLIEYDTAPLPRPAPYLVANLLPTKGAAYDLDDATYGQQVVPEPAVASLIVLFGGGMIFIRRIFSKA